MRVFVRLGGLLLGFAGLVHSASAGNDPVSVLADSICGAKTLDEVASIVQVAATENEMNPEALAGAFGLASFLGDLGRCANRQVIADGFVLFKQGRDPKTVDVAFARGRVAAKPETLGDSQAQVFQGSFAALGTAGEPPSGQ